MVDTDGEWTEKVSHPRNKPRKLNQTLCGFSKYVTAVVWRIHVVLLSSWRLRIIDGPGSKTRIRYHGYVLVIVNRKYVIGGAIFVQVIHIYIYISANIKSLDAFIYCRSTDFSKLWHNLIKRKSLWYMRIIFPREWKSIHRMLTYSADLTTCLKTGPATLSQGVICLAQNRRSATAGNINKVSTPTLVDLFIYHFKFRVCCFFKYIGNQIYNILFSKHA